jgi:class 3 adenylate cyclase
VLLDGIAGVIHRHGGTIDVLSGRRIGAFFGAPEALACAEKNALEAAADIIDACDGPGVGSPVDVRVALHSTPALAALVTAAGRSHYTVLGVEYDVIARLLASPAPAPIACSDAIAGALGSPAFLQPLAGGGFGWDPRGVGYAVGTEGASA